MTFCLTASKPSRYFFAPGQRSVITKRTMLQALMSLLVALLKISSGEIQVQ